MITQFFKTFLEARWWAFTLGVLLGNSLAFFILTLLPIPKPQGFLSLTFLGALMFGVACVYVCVYILERYAQQLR